MNDQRTTVPPAKPLRIACYGYAETRAGSVSSAGVVILSELLRRGVQIDFFNKSSFVRPRELEGLPGYRFFDVPNDKLERRTASLAKCGPVGRLLGSRWLHLSFTKDISKAMRQAHAEKPYDLQVWLGEWGWGRLPNVPVVSWVQGPPETDSSSIARHREELIGLIGRARYLALRSFAIYRATLARPPFHLSDWFVVGSEWSKKRLTSYGIAEDRISTLPYPVDLDRFHPRTEASAPTSSVPTVLWLGRTVPRKRLDLFLDACALLIRSGMPIDVRIVGGFGFVPEYRSLISRFPFPDSLRFDEHVPRDELSPLISSATVVVQPSEHENFGSAISEALACGTPVVLGPTNGTGDYIDAGGVRFSAYTPAAVAEAIRSAIADVDRLRPLARAAAEHWFRPEVVAGRLLEIYTKAVDDHRARQVAR